MSMTHRGKELFESGDMRISRATTSLIPMKWIKYRIEENILLIFNPLTKIIKLTLL